MHKNNIWQNELKEYIDHSQQEKINKANTWMTAIGLQAVDDLAISNYLLETAKEHIEGVIDISEVQDRILTYYQESSNRENLENTKEADIVSTKIAELIEEDTFQFSPAQWKSIHKHLFEDVYQHAGKFRKYNISKNEWILKGQTVIYASWNDISEIIEYDFNTEKKFSYEGLSENEVLKHIAKFTCDIWQIHPFCEGNTRATAVFIIKYLKYLGFDVSNKPFREHSWYFRNALVRANYNDIKNGVYATTRYLEDFFSNLLLGTDYDLKNRYLHLDYKSDEFKEDEFKYDASGYEIAKDAFKNDDIEYIIEK